MKNDLIDLKNQLKLRPPKAFIGYNTFKFEWTPKRLNLAKGEARVIYVTVVNNSKAYLTTIYLKKDKKDLTSDEYKNLKVLAKTLNKGDK